MASHVRSVEHTVQHTFHVSVLSNNFRITSEQWFHTFFPWSDMLWVSYRWFDWKTNWHASFNDDPILSFCYFFYSYYHDCCSSRPLRLWENWNICSRMIYVVSTHHHRNHKHKRYCPLLLIHGVIVSDSNCEWRINIQKLNKLNVRHRMILFSFGFCWIWIT